MRKALAAALAVFALVAGASPAHADPDVGRRSGLPFDSGVFAHSPERVAAYERVTGRPVDVWQVAPERGNGWEGLFDPWWLNAPNGVVLDVALPLPDQTVAEWARMGSLIASKSPTAYVRPGWEFNLYGSWEWTTDRIGDAEFVERFRVAATGLRRGCPRCRIEWNPNSAQGGVERASRAWPGDEHVDVVGVDVYDWSYENPITVKGGLNDWAEFARSKGKKVSLPEWGAHGVKGRGDNPRFVRDVLAWASRNADVVVMMSYFAEPASYIRNDPTTQMPGVASALREGFASAAARPVSKRAGQVRSAPPAAPTPAPAALAEVPGLPPLRTDPVPEALREFKPHVQAPPPFTVYEFTWGDGGLRLREQK